MADLRISTSPAVRPVGTPVNTQALRAAQRAFFDAALAQPATPTALGPAAQPVSAIQPIGGASSADPRQPPTRLLRPGSLVDIKV